VFPVRYELGFYTPEDDVLHSHRRQILNSYKSLHVTSLLVFDSMYSIFASNFVFSFWENAMRFIDIIEFVRFFCLLIL
jgi:hypothetical protein